MRMQFVRMLHWPSGESTMAPENEKLQNTSTTHSHEPTRLPNHTPTEPPTHTHQATHPRRATAIQQYTYTRTCVGTAWVHAEFVPVSVVLGFPLFDYYPPSRGASDSSPGGPFHAPRSPRRSSAPVLSPVRHRAAVWDVRGATARLRDAKWSSRLATVFGVCYNQNIVKDPNDYYDVTSVLLRSI